MFLRQLATDNNTLKLHMQLWLIRYDSNYSNKVVI